MANAFKCDFCNTLVGGVPKNPATELYAPSMSGVYHSPRFVGVLQVSFMNQDDMIGEPAALCLDCGKRFARRIAEEK